MGDPVLRVYENLNRALPAAADVAQKLRQAMFHAQHPVAGDSDSTSTEIAELQRLLQRAACLHADLINVISARQLPRRKADQVRRKNAANTIVAGEDGPRTAAADPVAQTAVTFPAILNLKALKAARPGGIRMLQRIKRQARVRNRQLLRLNLTNLAVTWKGAGLPKPDPTDPSAPGYAALCKAAETLRGADILTAYRTCAAFYGAALEVMP